MLCMPSIGGCTNVGQISFVWGNNRKHFTWKASFETCGYHILQKKNTSFISLDFSDNCTEFTTRRHSQTQQMLHQTLLWDSVESTSKSTMRGHESSMDFLDDDRAKFEEQTCVVCRGPLLVGLGSISFACDSQLRHDKKILPTTCYYASHNKMCQSHNVISPLLIAKNSSSLFWKLQYFAPLTSATLFTWWFLINRKYSNDPFDSVAHNHAVSYVDVLLKHEANIHTP